MPQLTFRVDDELAERVERVTKEMQAHPSFAGLDITRTNVLKLLITRGLAITEPEHFGTIAGMTREESRKLLATEAHRLAKLAERFEVPLEVLRDLDADT